MADLRRRCRDHVATCVPGHVARLIVYQILDVHRRVVTSLLEPPRRTGGAPVCSGRGGCGMPRGLPLEWPLDWLVP